MSYKMKLFITATLICFVHIASPADELFNGKDVIGFRKPTGAWMAAKDVAMDPADPEKFIVTHGEGILVNGTKGKTVNLISEAEFADVEVHVEFWIPKHSNSGVYVMGRYEIQIYDGEIK